MDTRKLWAVTAREYAERVRTKWFLISTIFGPLLFGALMVLPGYLAARSKPSREVARIIILDATGSGLGSRIGAALAGPTGDTALAQVRSVAPAALSAAEDSALRAAMASEVRGYMVVDTSTLARGQVRYAGRNATSVADMKRLEEVVQQAVLGERLARAGLPPADANALSRVQVNLATERVTDKGRGGSGMVSVVTAFLIAFLLYMSIIIYGQNVLRGVMEEKMTRVAEVVMSSVSASTLLAGKVLGVGAVALTQLVVWGASGVLIAKARDGILSALGVAPAPLPLPDIGLGVGLLLLAFFVLGFVFYCSLYAAIGSTVNSEQEAQQASMPLVLLLVASVIFVNPVLFNPTGALAVVVSVLPFSAPIIMPLRLSLISVPPLEVAAAVILLALACVAAVWFAARVYRVGLLMYGKRPTARELARWVRYSP